MARPGSRAARAGPTRDRRPAAIASKATATARSAAPPPASGGSGAAMRRAPYAPADGEERLAVAMIAERLAVVGQIAIGRVGDDQGAAIGRPRRLAAAPGHENRVRMRALAGRRWYRRASRRWRSPRSTRRRRASRRTRVDRRQAPRPATTRRRVRGRRASGAIAARELPARRGHGRDDRATASRRPLHHRRSRRSRRRRRCGRPARRAARSRRRRVGEPLGRIDVAGGRRRRHAIEIPAVDRRARRRPRDRRASTRASARRRAET